METTKKINWEVIEKPIYANNSEIKGYKGLFRNDTNKLLNVTKQSYTPTTNARFLEVVEKMHQITGFPIVSYDEFEGGRKILAFLECTGRHSVQKIEICGHEFQDFMLIANSHDSSTGFFIGNSSEMIRCSNRFTKNFRQLKVNHTKNHDRKIDDLLKYSEMFTSERQRLFAKMEKFTSKKVDSSIRKALIERLVKITEQEKLGTSHENFTTNISTRKLNIIANLNDSIDRECADLGNNAFGLFNGITHYTTHIKQQSKNKILGNPFGSLNELNQTAFKFCEELT